MNDPLLTPKQVMALLSISRSTLLRLQQAGKLRPIRLTARSIRYSAAEVEKLLQRCTQKASA